MTGGSLHLERSPHPQFWAGNLGQKNAAIFPVYGISVLVVVFPLKWRRRWYIKKWFNIIMRVQMSSKPGPRDWIRSVLVGAELVERWGGGDFDFTIHVDCCAIQAAEGAITTRSPWLILPPYSEHTLITQRGIYPSSQSGVSRVIPKQRQGKSLMQTTFLALSCHRTFGHLSDVIQRWGPSPMLTPPSYL